MYSNIFLHSFTNYSNKIICSVKSTWPYNYMIWLAPLNAFGNSIDLLIKSFRTGFSGPVWLNMVAAMHSRAKYRPTDPVSGAARNGAYPMAEGREGVLDTTA